MGKEPSAELFFGIAGVDETDPYTIFKVVVGREPKEEYELDDEEDRELKEALEKHGLILEQHGGEGCWSHALIVEHTLISATWNNVLNVSEHFRPLSLLHNKELLGSLTKWAIELKWSGPAWLLICSYS